MRCAVLGSPIGHSLSPTLHRAAYRELGLDWEYDAVDVTEAGLAVFLDGRDATWRGLSLTMPLKRTVVPLLDTADPLVRATGVANTVVLEDGRRNGANTDIPGAVRAIQERDPGPLTSALLLGGGATAASLGWALTDTGCRFLELFVRNPATAAETLAVLQGHPERPHVRVRRLAQLDEALPADIVASTIPAAAQTEGVLEALESTEAGVVFDALYDPWPTSLAAWAQQSGRILVTGLDLLVHQAALQVELMTGRLPAVAPMRRAGMSALESRDRS